MPAGNHKLEFVMVPTVYNNTKIVSQISSLILWFGMIGVLGVWLTMTIRKSDKASPVGEEK